jgi:hypothetical protein
MVRAPSGKHEKPAPGMRNGLRSGGKREMLFVIGEEIGIAAGDLCPGAIFLIPSTLPKQARDAEQRYTRGRT